MLLAFDIGNTNIVVGCFDDGELKEVLRLKTVSERTVDEYSALIMPLLERKFGGELSVERAIISSVVPPITGSIDALLKRELNIQPLFVGPGIKTGLSIKVSDQGSVGADRVVNAVAAKELYGCPAIVIDFGTATSFDVVGEAGDYEGGIISPGVEISLDALVSKTAKLPRIHLEWPETLIGKSTEQAMLSGVVFGYLSLIEGIIDRLRSELSGVKNVIATGGAGALFADRSEKIDIYSPDLTLQGLKILDEINRDN